MSGKLIINREFEGAGPETEDRRKPLDADKRRIRELFDLASSGATLARLLDAAGDAISLIDGSQGRRLWANRAFREAASDDRKGSPGACAPTRSAMRAIASGKTEEETIEDASGSSLRVRSVPVLADGKAIAVFELREDPVRLGRFDGELKRIRSECEHRLEQQAEESARLIREREWTLDRTKEFVYRHDETGVFTYLSPSVERITGYSLEEWSQHYTQYLTDHPDNDWVVQATERSLRTGQKSHPYLVEIYHKNGTRLTLEVDEEPVLEDGIVTGIVGVAREVTERVLAERIRKEGQRSLQLILDALPLGVFWKDCESRYLGCNRVFARDAGKGHPRDVIGLTDFDLIWGDLAERYRGDDFEVMERGEAKLDCEERYSLPDGRRARLRMSKIPLRDDEGRVTGVLGIYEDVSARNRPVPDRRERLVDQFEKRTRQLAEIRDEVARRSRRFETETRGDSDKGRGGLRIGSLERDLSIPLQWAIDLIGKKLQGETPPIELDELKSAQSSAKVLSGLFGDLLRISSAKSDSAPRPARPFDLEALLADVLAILRPSAREKELELKLDYAVRLPRRVHGDRIRLRQVLLTLADHAIARARSGSIRLEADIARGGQAEILVRTVERRGETPSRKEGPREPAGRDRELGLADCRRLVEEMNGRLQIDLEGDRDRPIRIVLPLPGMDSPPRWTKVPESRSGKPRESLHRVLLVSAGQDSRGSLKERLERFGCEVADSDSFERSAELARTGLFDAVILDCGEDQEKAFRAAAEIRAREADGVASLLLGICERPTPKLREHCLRSGMLDLLDRTMEDRAFGKIVDEILSAR